MFIFVTFVMYLFVFRDTAVTFTYLVHVKFYRNRCCLVIAIYPCRSIEIPSSRKARAVSRCVCSSLMQAQIEIAPRSRDGFLQLFEGRKSARRQAGGISSSRGTDCKTLLLVWPSETRVAHRPGKWLLRRETRNTVDLSCQRETRDTIKVGR